MDGSKKFSSLINIFSKYFGESSISQLKTGCNRPTILIAGNQLTGKSTMAKKLANHYVGGEFYSVGMMFRELAASLNISVGEQSRLLLELELAEQQNLPPNKSNPLYGKKVDVEIDYRTLKIIQNNNNNNQQQQQNKSIDNYYVIEGRQPALLGTYLKEELNRENLIRIYVECSVREKSIRFLEREIGKQAAEIAEKSIPHDTNLNDLSSVTEYISKLNLPNISDVVNKFKENQNRDLNDRNRYINQYGLDYEDKSFYDFVVDTSNATSDINLRKVTNYIDSLPNYKFEIKQR
ncbi:hypothetical protein PPL_11563 [Heterostelium album PN500]|uniref:(d)CMP kinase n=1 Tax=Heterostelium pallidum (strain ATCC 26659 / Pp 5 / PN500) TaxID=670386 RepID=D3BVH2_HETP5|nr:hypothetical protein PPL_11563 [Heterostelium album PN500]EFA74595.1 hypothetical protein PPL_11563 [Heterostelium album PN500]|eukprot:XP_020426729.1 hypothetical protein PPL_11563 [Heterostelium album PN500]